MLILSKTRPADARLEESRALRQRFRTIRSQTEKITSPLLPEDCVIQSMPDVSPPKWHLAHTSWFFETFILAPSLRDYQPFQRDFAYLFNSYYKGLGKHYPRHARGLLSRPTLEEIDRYRHYIDEKIEGLFENSPELLTTEILKALELGLHHEQQHQELLLTDIQHIFFSNPLRPVYWQTAGDEAAEPVGPLSWVPYSSGIAAIGYTGEGFSFDNERPRHRVFLQDYELASRLVTQGEYLEFIRDNGYRRPELWLSDGWDAVLRDEWKAPIYWEEREGEWWTMTLSGMKPLDPAEPVSHLSHYEADAYARWAGARLPTEAEWEHAAESVPIEGNFLESESYHPRPLASCASAQRPAQLFGDVWEWTQSAYLPYPGFQIHPGALGEYNGKFMSGQIVLRGGSCLTPQSHLRASYRNFFPPSARWQCAGLRLARDG